MCIAQKRTALIQYCSLIDKAQCQSFSHKHNFPPRQNGLVVSIWKLLFTKAVTELSKDDFSVMPSLLIKMIPATFLESWILRNVSSNSGVRLIFAAGPWALIKYIQNSKSSFTKKSYILWSWNINFWRKKIFLPFCHSFKMVPSPAVPK